MSTEIVLAWMCALLACLSVFTWFPGYCRGWEDGVMSTVKMMREERKP